jgi:hypothetical protein
MLVHDMIPDLLVARGLDRRHASALLRAVQNHDEDDRAHFGQAVDINDVIHDLAHAMGCDDMTIKDGALQYDAAIARNVTLRAEQSSWKALPDMTIVVKGEIPTTTITALQDQPLRRLVDHPLLPGDIAIRGISVGDGRTTASIRPCGSPIAVVARATQMDMAMLRWRLWLKRRRDVRISGAAEGLTPLTVLIAMAFASAAVTSAIVAPTLVAPIAIVGIAIVVWRFGREDKALEERLWDMRYRRLAERRKSILEGKSP